MDDCESDSFTICGRGDSASKQPTWQGHGSEHAYGLKMWVCILVPRLHAFAIKENTV